MVSLLLHSCTPLVPSNYLKSLLKEVAIADYKNAIDKYSIKNHNKYMMACIWSAMQKGKAASVAKYAYEVNESMPDNRSG